MCLADGLLARVLGNGVSRPGIAGKAQIRSRDMDGFGGQVPLWKAGCLVDGRLGRPDQVWRREPVHMAERVESGGLLAVSTARHVD